MKKILLLVMVVLLFAMALTSCSFETSMCPSYGGIKRKTSYGHKAQAKYARHFRKAI
jgi:hypothetical protein